jgi:dTDP-4-amino-4,6-dideoxygalactose transaminase
MEGALRRRYLTNNGPLVTEFEERVAARLGVRHCITTSSATTGLMVLARALELRGEILVPSFTFVGTVHAMRWLGLRPVFCDVDPMTHSLDAEAVRKSVTETSSAVLGVHVWGRPCDIDALQAVTSAHKIPLLFDAAAAFDCSRSGVRVGSFGVAEVVSFHATKVLNTFEGGAILTNDDELAPRLRRMTRFGFEGEDVVLDLGINAKMSEAAAAMGIAQLEYVDEFIAVNREHLRQYRDRLGRLHGVSLFEYEADREANCHYVVIEIDGERAPLDRDTLKRVLVAENVLARRYFYPGCHRHPPYAVEQPSAAERLPNTERLVERVLQLPTGTAVTSSDVDQICDIIERAFEHADEIRGRLGVLAS